MASSKIKGITVEIGGDTTKLGDAIGDVEKKSKSLQGELKYIDKLLKFDPGNTDLLAQKQDVLKLAIAETSEKLEILRKTQDQVVDAFNRGDIGEDQLRSFQREVIKTETDLKALEAQLDGSVDSFGDMGDAAEDSGNSAEGSSDGFTIMGGAIADLVSNAIQWAISAIGDFIGALFDLSEATEEYRQMQGKLEGSATNFGYSVEFATGKYKDFYKYVGDDQMATNAITNLMGLGLATDDVSKLTDGAIATWTAYGDSIPIEPLTESMAESINVGKVTGTLADTINWAKLSNEEWATVLGKGSKAQKAFNKSLKDGETAEDAFSAALGATKDEQERARMVAELLNTTYGESKTKYDEMSEGILEANEAELELKDTQAELGKTMEPVNTAITEMKTKALEALAPLVEKLAQTFLDLLQYFKEHPAALHALTAVVIGLATAFGVLATALGIQMLIQGITKAFAFLNTTLLANPIVLIVAAIAGLVAAFIYLWNNCEGFRQFWIDLWNKLKEAYSVVVDALIQFFTVTIPNAWTNFITFCSNFITNIVTFFQELPGKIWNAIVGVYERVTTWGNNVYTRMKTAATNAINAVVDWFKQLPGRIWTWLVNAVTRVTTWGANLLSTATNAARNMVTTVITWVAQLPGRIWSAIVGAVSRVATWGSQLLSTAKSKISSMVSSVVSTAQAIPGRLYSAIQGAISRVKTWGSNLISAAGSAISNMGERIVSIAKQIPGKFLSIGRDIVNGIKNGIGNALGGLYNYIENKLTGMVDKAKSALGINSPSKVFANVVGKAIPEGIAKGINDNTKLAGNAIQGMTDDLVNQSAGLNSATLNRKLSTTFNTGDITNVVDNTAILSELRGIYERLGNLQIVLDSGTLVGETIDKIDAGLANKQLLSARGI